MYERIVLPLDLSEEHDAVLEAVLRLGEGVKSVCLLHVVESIRGIPDVEVEGFYASLRPRAEANLAAAAARLKEAGLEAQTEIRTGPRGPTIVRYAIECGADLIILSSRATDPDRPGFGFGSTSHQVALAAPCSVLLIRGEA